VSLVTRRSEVLTAEKAELLRNGDNSIQWDWVSVTSCQTRHLSALQFYSWGLKTSSISQEFTTKWRNMWLFTWTLERLI